MTKLQSYCEFTVRKVANFGTIISLAVFFLVSILILNSCTKDDADLIDSLETDFTSILPSNLEDSVIVDPIVSVTFKDGTDPQVISSTEISLKKGTYMIPGKTSVSGASVQFIADGDLNEESEYTAIVTTKHGSGKDNRKEYSWRFRTGRHHSYNWLKVESVSPLNNAIAVNADASLIVTFNRELTYLLKNVISVTLKNGSAPVEGTLSFSGKTANFIPNVPLDAKTTYQGSVQIGLKSNGENHDDDDDDDDDEGDDDDDDDQKSNKFTWSFTTAGGASDVTGPAVSSVSPENNAVSVPLGKNPTVTFSVPMDPTSITTSTFSLKQGTSVVAGTVSVTGAIATFKPNLPLTADKTYTATITTGAKDAAGNSLASAYVWSFTTEGAIDVTAPTVLTVVPANASLTAPITTKATITFSESMNPATINSTSISLKQGTTSIAGTVTLSGATATFTPSAALEANKVYTGNVTTSAKDVAGNALASNYSWSFTTSSASDVIAPVVSSVVPANNATAIAVNSKATATFSEAMNAATITSSTFTLKQGSTTVAGSVTYSGTTATFTPSAALTANTVYTASITTGAKDAAGNSLAATYTWSFTTVAASDNTAPSITNVAPANNATSVALSSKATASFSEAMNVATITSSTFTLKQGSTTVAGSVTYSGTTATFTPSAALTANTVYTASITTGAKDAAGNSLAAPYTWSFTTVAAATGKSFATDVMPILGICNDCHNHNWTASTNASTFYTNLVNSGHVNPSSPTSGRIYTKVNGGHPSSSITAAQKTTILTWVTEGSKNN